MQKGGYEAGWEPKASAGIPLKNTKTGLLCLMLKKLWEGKAGCV